MISVLVLGLAQSATAGPNFEDLNAPEFGADERVHWIDIDTLPIGYIGPTNPESTAIVNGSTVSGNNNVVALAGLADWGGYVFCSGTLIDARWVVTAAHCVVEIPSIRSQGMDVYILWGDDLLGQGYTDAIEVANHYPHPNYNDLALQNDIAVVELVSAKVGVDLAVLNNDAVDNSWVGNNMRFYGFGVTLDDRDDAGVKRTTDIQVSGYDTHFITSYTNGTNLCQGDSGGPAFELVGANMEIAGINSYVSPQCEGGSNGVTRVDQHIAWIKDYVPNVLTAGSGEGSNPGDGSGTGASGDDVFVDPGSANNADIDREFSDVSRVTDGHYATGVRCNTSAASASGAAGLWVFLGPLLTLFRRQRA